MFTDQTAEDIDLVLYATGYDWTIPYLPNRYFTWSGGRPASYLTAFNPSHRNLITAGFVETNSSAYTLFDEITNVVAQYLNDQSTRPDNATRFERHMTTDRPDLSGGIRFIGSDRHRAYVDIRAFKKYLARIRKQFGWADLTPGMFERTRV